MYIKNSRSFQIPEEFYRIDDNARQLIHTLILHDILNNRNSNWKLIVTVLRNTSTDPEITATKGFFTAVAHV